MTCKYKLQIIMQSTFARLLLIAAVALVACARECMAQSGNPLDISDDLYRVYSEAFPQRATPEGLKLAGQMYDKAVKKGDRKAQCAALTLTLSYYYYARNDKNFESVVQKLQQKSKEYDFESYYYYAFSSKVNYLLNKGDLKQAHQYVRDMETVAKHHNHQYGLYVCMTSLAQVYMATREIGMAVENLNQALRMIDALKLGAGKVEIYRKLASCYEELYSYDKMLEYGRKALAVSHTPMQEMRSIYPICYALLMLGHEDEFEKYYNMYVKLRGGITPDTREFEEQTIAILKMLHDGDLASAYKYIMKKNRRLVQLRLLSEYYRRKEDYRSMSKVQTELYRRHINYADEVLMENYDETFARLLNLRLDLQHQQLQHAHSMLENERQAAALKNANLKLANTQLTLRNSSLELSRTRSESDLLRLSYNRKQLETARLKGHIVTTQAQSQFYDMLSMLGFAVGVIVFVGIGLYLRTRAMLMADLKDTNTVLAQNNRELVTAKEHAEAANNVKTTFFNNMSDDIRQPLETIAHLSTLIANAGKDTPKERLNELSHQIDVKTVELLHIVDGVLKNT